MKPLLRIAAILAVALAAVAGREAVAQCDIKIRDLQQVTFSGHGGAGYEVFRSEQYAEAFAFTIERRSGSCEFFVGLSAGQSGSFDRRLLLSGGNVLGYQLYKTVGAARTLKDLPAASADELLSGSVAPGQDQVNLTAVFMIPFQQVVPPGTYRDTVMVRLYEGTPQLPQLRDQKQLRLSATVPATAEFCLGDVAIFEAGYRNACIDFGPLVKGAVRELTLRARSNAGYRITMRSQNGGALRILDPQDTSTIPYMLQVNGQPVPLDGKKAATALQADGLTSAFGAEHRLRFTIGETAGAAAGAYQDVIEVTLYAGR